MSKLRCVTITGADDGVDPKALIALSTEFPFAEWGLLRSEKRAGAPRYPSKDWLTALFRAITHLRECDFARSMHPSGEVRLAMHVCGQISRDAMSGYGSFWDDEDLWYDRVQLNGFSNYVLPGLRIADALAAKHFAKPVEVILQCSDSAALGRAAELGARYPNVTALYDPSGGRGLPVWECRVLPPVGLRFGVAGGVGPDTIVQVIDQFPQAEWVDGESAYRTDDHFDLGKVRRVLELAAPFVEAHDG